MNKPASAPDVIPPRPPAEPQPADEGEGTNAVRHRPDPRADPPPTGVRKHVPRSPHTHGNS